MKATDNFFQNQPEPFRSFFIGLRSILLNDPQISESLKYGIPFYSCRGRMLCYIWKHKKLGQPYLGIVDGKLIDHPGLLQEKRVRIKILPFDMTRDIPVKTIIELLRKMKKLRDS